jgi:5-formyltetrahydrofolate cyclo-ligase
MTVPRWRKASRSNALDPERLDQPTCKAASISGASRPERRVTLEELALVGLLVVGCVPSGRTAHGWQGRRLRRLGPHDGYGGGPDGPRTVTVATVHEIQVKPAGTIPLTGHDVLSTLWRRPSA